MRTLVLVAILISLTAPVVVSDHTVEPVVDPELLGYQFRTHKVITLNSSNGEYAPMRYATDTQLGAYELASHWRDDTLSFVVFWRDILLGGAISQFNRKVWGIMAHHAADLDGDGGLEIVISYGDLSGAWVEIIDVRNVITYKRMLLIPEDLNQNGRWDGGVAGITAVELNGDGYSELIVSLFSGFDLYPRTLFCLDWKKDTLLWQQDFSGHPGQPLVIYDERVANRKIVLPVSSMANAVTAGSMDDRHCYLLCFTAGGELLWKRVPGGIFSFVSARLFDADGDERDEILTWTNFGSDDDADRSDRPGALLEVLNSDGVSRKEMTFPADLAIKSVITGDLDQDGYDEILVSTSDRKVTVFDQSLTAVDRYLFPAEVNLWKCADFLGQGKNQVMVVTEENQTLLLSNSFDLLAQYDGALELRRSSSFAADFVTSGEAVLLFEQGESVTRMIYFERLSFMHRVGVFLVMHRQMLFMLLGAMVIALLYTNYHRRKIRRNLTLISQQRDELERTHEELQKTLQGLKVAQTRLVQSEKMAALGLLVAGLAHEMNSPMGAVVSNSNTAARYLDRLRNEIETIQNDRAKAEALLKLVTGLDKVNRLIELGADRVSEIVKRLKSFVRLDEAELQRVDLHRCLDETLDMLRSRMMQKILVTRDYSDLPPIPCFPGQLNQVFLNLIENAMEAIGDRGEITIRTFRDDGSAVIEVSDTGSGIPTERLEKVFDPGFTTKGVGIGTGMGLAICYQIIQEHRGELTVNSTVGEGTTVSIRLPMTLA
jgi:signal transduction histidine kinase